MQICLRDRIALLIAVAQTIGWPIIEYIISERVSLNSELKYILVFGLIRCASASFKINYLKDNLLILYKVELKAYMQVIN
jgi:hypothetical protein